MTIIFFVQAKQKELEAMTPWEQYLSKKKEKRKAKKQKSKNNSEKEETAANDDDSDKPFSDDELPEGVDLDDPFFQTLDVSQPDKSNKKKKRDEKKGKKNGKKNEVRELSVLTSRKIEGCKAFCH